MPVISFTLDTGSVNHAVRQLRKYIDELDGKVARLREMIADRIGWRASEGFATALVGDVIRGPEPTSDVQVTVSHGDKVSIVMADGNEAVFIEFGAGVYNNGAAGSSPHPWGAERGYLIGTYGQGKGTRNVWGYYLGGDKKNLVLTHGTPAAMPMYHGVQDALAVIDSLVQEVFG